MRAQFRGVELEPGCARQLSAELTVGLLRELDEHGASMGLLLFQSFPRFTTSTRLRADRDRVFNGAMTIVLRHTELDAQGRVRLAVLDFL